MNREQIKSLALACGFKLKEQADGTHDLNDYVYAFAEKLIERFIQTECELRYYEIGQECAVSDLASEYGYSDMTRGEIARVDKYYSTPSKTVYVTKIYSEDEYQILDFPSIEDAQKAIDENKYLADVYFGED